MAADLKEGIWRLADPKISITSLASMTIGGSVAARDGYLLWEWHGILLLALFFMEVAKNAWGDVYDYDSGTDLAVLPEDRTDFSGGKRVIVDGLLTRADTWKVAFVFGLMGLALGAFIVFVREPSVFWIGAGGLIVGWSYHGPPLQFAYRGLGELAVVFCYGPVIALCTYLIQAQVYSMEVFWLAMPLGIFIAAFLWVNEFPDFLADKQANKRNMIVRLGKQLASRILPVIYLTGFILLAAIPMLTTLDVWIWLGFLAVPFALTACLWTWLNPDDFYRSRPVQPFTLLAFVIYAAGAGTGVLVGG